MISGHTEPARTAGMPDRDWLVIALGLLIVAVCV